MRSWEINFYGFTLLQKELEEEYITKFTTKLDSNKMVTDIQIKNYTLDHAKMLKLYNNVILYVNGLIDERQEAHSSLMQQITRAKIAQIFKAKEEVKKQNLKAKAPAAPKVKK